MNIDSMIQGNPQALVTSYNGVLVADSLEVADRFGKRHTHVLRSIDDLINQLESQSTQNWADYFIPDDYQDNKNRTQRRFKLAVFNKAVAETITRAVCTISGKDYTLPIKSVTVEGATFKVNIYLDDTLSGTVTNTKLYDKDGNLLIQRQDVVPKPEEKNLLVVFQLELREVAL